MEACCRYATQAFFINKIKRLIMSYMLEELQRRLNSLTEERKKQIELLDTKSLEPSKIREMSVSERKYYFRVRSGITNYDKESEILYDME
jgi:hypothetical protein